VKGTEPIERYGGPSALDEFQLRPQLQLPPAVAERTLHLEIRTQICCISPDMTVENLARYKPGAVFGTPRKHRLIADIP
jgi:hypothetical protein